MHAAATQAWAAPAALRAPPESLLLEAFFAACRNPSSVPCSRQLAARRSVAGLELAGGGSSFGGRSSPRDGDVQQQADASGSAESMHSSSSSSSSTVSGKRLRPSQAATPVVSGCASGAEVEGRASKRIRVSGEGGRRESPLDLKEQQGFEALFGGRDVETSSKKSSSFWETSDFIAFPLTLAQQEDLCLALITALGRLRPQWRRRAGRLPFQLHFARLRPSLLPRFTPSPALPVYVSALRPLVANVGEFEFTHMSAQDALRTAWELQALRGPQAIDRIIQTLDSLHEQFLFRGKKDPAASHAALAVGAFASSVEETFESEAPASPRRSQKIHQFPHSLHEFQPASEATNASSGLRRESQAQHQQQQPERTGATSARPPLPETLTLAYDPDLRIMRQLNYLVSGTRAYMFTQVLNDKFAELGLPPLPQPPLPEGPRGSSSLHKFSVVEVGERFFEFPFGEHMTFRAVLSPHQAIPTPPQTQQPAVHFPVGFVAQLLAEGRLCLMRFTEREALKRRVPLPVPAGAGSGADSGLSTQLGFKGPRGSKPTCCPAPAGIEKVCRCKCNHRRQELYGDLKQKLRTDRKACLAAIRDCVDLQQVAFQLQSARTYQLEMLSYLFGVDPWKYAKNKHEAPPPQQIPELIRRYKALVQSKEYEQLYKQWMEEQAREKSMQQEIAADITAIGLNMRNGGVSAALSSAQDARIQSSLQQLLPGTPVCVRVKALLGLPSGNEQHIRGVVRRVQVLPKGRAISVALNNRTEEFVLLADEVETLLAHDDLRLVRMRSRQWVSTDSQQSTTAAASATNELSQQSQNHWAAGSHSAGAEDSWRDNQSEATFGNE